MVFSLIIRSALWFNDSGPSLDSVSKADQKVIELWPNGAPGAVGTEDTDRPSLEVYLPPAANATETAVIICPGGGYIQLDMIHEGRETAEWLNSLGLTSLC
jgi:acetyl esterase/lipase